VDQLAARFGAPLVMVHRAALHAALVAALGEDTIQLDRHCVALEQGDDGVRLTFADGSEATGQVVVGADGLRSVVRAITLADGPPRPRGVCAWRAVTTVTAHLAEELAGGEWWARGSVFGAQHLPNSQVYWYAARRAQPEKGTAPEGEKPMLLDVFGDWPVPVPQLIETTAANDILRNDLFDRSAPETMACGRVALVGDAAHPMLPYIGQGACQAIEDGLAVARALADSPGSPASAVEIYSRKRVRPATAAVVQSARMARVAHLRNPLGVTARKALLKRASDESVLARLAPIVGGADPTPAEDASEAPR
jgi:2-polyprenyl-6-methoxyphenol hydroxylase-like FAD-dependent oxidoreductase